MSFCAQRFNLYLLATLLAFTDGCATPAKKSAKIGIIRVHVASSANLPGTGQTVQILRSQPVLVPISNDPVVTEVNLIAATLIEAPGGFAVSVRFDETGTWVLEQASARNPGKHFALYGQWGDKPEDGRWLAAPLINRRIANGTLSFTPDCSREEAQKWVDGLTYQARERFAPKTK